MPGSSKRWVYFEYNDELRYYGRGSKVYAAADIGDVEIMVSDNGEIVDLVINHASRYFRRGDIKRFADIITVNDIKRLSRWSRAGKDGK